MLKRVLGMAKKNPLTVSIANGKANNSDCNLKNLQMFLKGASTKDWFVSFEQDELH